MQGVSDKYSWIPGMSSSFLACLLPSDLGLTSIGVFEGEGAALMWNRNYKKKPAYFGFLKGTQSGGKN
jgi:endo-1,4-beta-xylanase